MSKKRTVVFTSLFEFGGSNTYLRLLSDILHDNEVCLVLKNANELTRFKRLSFDSIYHSPRVLSGLQQIAKIDGSTLVNNPKQFVLSLISIIRIICLLLRLRTRRIIISSVDPEAYLYFICVPFVQVRYVLHTVPVKAAKTFSSTLCNHFLNDNKKVIAVSRYEKDELVKLWKIKTRQNHVTVIHNTVFNENNFLKNQWRSDNNVVLTLGHTVEYKNPYLWIDVAIKITAAFPEIVFKWVGDGALFEELVERTKKYERIIFVKGDNNISDYFSKSYLYYQPSKVESHGIAVLEAMASSMPCIVSNAGGLPESVTNNFNGFVVDTYDEKQHVDAISKLISDKKLGEQFSLNSLDRYKECFCYDVWQQKMKGSFEFK